MADHVLEVRMFGNFSVRKGDQEINDSDNRSRKVWLLLAYMIYCRSRSITQDELVGLLWSDGESSSNPLNALKTMFHRVRSSLNQLDSTAGHSLIIRRDGNYTWNPDVPFFFDVDEFERLCRAGAMAQSDDQRLEDYLQALDLYRGDFLQKLSSEAWVIPISAYFHNLYIHTLLETLTLLEERDQMDQAAALCRGAIAIEPYNELIYQHLMRDLLAQGQQREVISIYEDMSQLLFDNFGIMPADESRALYREAVRTVNDRAVSMGTLREQLREPDGLSRRPLLRLRFLQSHLPCRGPRRGPQRGRGAHLPALCHGCRRRRAGQAQLGPVHGKPAGADPHQPPPGRHRRPVQCVPVHSHAAPGQL